MPTENSKERAGFTLKERIILTALLALAAPLTVFIFGSIDIFANNSAEFSFVLSDFMLWNALYTLAGAAVIAAILLPLKGRAFDIAYSVIFWLSVMLFIQGNYLNFGMGGLAGDGEGSISTLTVIVDLAIWLIFGAAIISAVVLFGKKYRDIVKTVAMIALVTVIGMQLLTTLTLALTSDAFMSHEDRVEQNSSESGGAHVLSYKDINTSGRDGNIVYFVIDRFDYNYYLAAMEECPEIFDELDGFTCYDDAISLYVRTYPSIAYMITGVEHDFTRSRNEYFNYAYSNSEYLKRLKESGYSINIYTDTYHAYTTADSFGEYVSNDIVEGSDYGISGGASLAFKVAMTSMYRYFPHLAKLMLGVNSAEFGEHVIYDSEHPRYTTDMRNLYNTLMKDSMSLKDGKSFSFIHFSGTHPPYLYDEDFNKLGAGESVEPVSALKQSFKIINRYISEMKRLGVYDDATIVITGDHGYNGYLETFNTLPIFFKPADKDSGGIVHSSAQVCHENIMPAIFKSVGIDATGLALALTDIKEGVEMSRRYSLQYFLSSEGRKFEQIDFLITGTALDPKNWVITNRYRLDGDIYS